ncbi:hypothetical protein [Alkalihalobacterium elongatum]|uniref:hypothetical protein n=1 Tax=Alkalihalobacterium elongatum TaxID=2675466 RepID=UPI001C1F7CAD|nr:hypothetical protein [Alkalihalobacterium elongatum]
MNSKKKRLAPGSYHTSGYVHVNQPSGNNSSPYQIFSSSNKPAQPKSGGCGCGNKTIKR